jgi:hypothetical protein
MRLTIIPSDKTVYVDTVPYALLGMASVPFNVHALQWFDVEGWIEFIDAPNENITELPAWANTCVSEWEAADYEHKHPPAPPPPTAQDNKNTAVRLLSETDWTALPDVADPLKSNPYLVNANAFNTYRNEVRQYALNPVSGNIDWPVYPNEDWRTT